MNCFASLVVLASAASVSACAMPVPCYRNVDIVSPEAVLPPCSEDHPSGCVYDPAREAAAEEAAEPETATRVIVVEEAPTRASDKLPVMTFGAADRLPPAKAAFDAVDAHARLEAVDMSDCRAHALARGYLHAHVAFAPSGRVDKIAVDEAPGHPGDLPDDARTCIRDHLSGVAVASFDGAPATVAASWFVQ